MTVTKDQVRDKLRRVKGPDLDGNLVDLGLLSEILIKDARVYFSITVPAHRAEELEPLRKAAETVVNEIPGVAGVTAVLTADAPTGTAGTKTSTNVHEHPRVTEARARGAAGDGAARQKPPMQTPGGAPRGTGRARGEASDCGRLGQGRRRQVDHCGQSGARAARDRAARSGMLDADIYGPSMPRLLGLKGQPQRVPANKLKPMAGYGLQGHVDGLPRR